MPEVICKVIHEDGTESSYGPLTINNEDSTEIESLLGGYEEERVGQMESDRLEEAIKDSERASAEAEASNQARIEQSNQGLDPDTGEAH